jgi:hypothetical protein
MLAQYIKERGRIEGWKEGKIEGKREGEKKVGFHCSQCS